MKQEFETPGTPGVQAGSDEPVSLDEVLVTEKLSLRDSRPPDHKVENRALRALSRTLASDPDNLLQKLVETILEFIPSADSAGISNYVSGHDGDVFQWDAVAGLFAENVGGSMPRDESPCGIVIDRNRPVLVEHPGRFFGALANVEPPVVETLLVPFHIDGQPAGTVWAVSHGVDHRFDAEDRRLLTSLSRFASAGYQFARGARHREELRERVRARTTQRNRAEGEARRSRRRLKAIFEHSLDAILLADDEGRYVDANEAASELLGYSIDELCELSVWDLTPGQHREEGVESWQRFLREGTMEGEYTMDRKDGTPVETEFRATANIVPGLHLSIIRDITERKNAEEALRKSDEKYRALFNSMDEAYAVVEVLSDEEGRWTDFLFLDANPAFVEHTGMEYPVGQTATELLGTPNPRWAEVYGHVAETGEPVRIEESEPLLDKVFDLNVFRLGGPGSRRVAVLFTDITERRRAEEALRESEERFRALVNASTDVVYRMSPDWSEMRELDGRGFILDTEQPSDRWLHEYIHPDDYPKVREAIEEAVRSKSMFELEHRVRRTDGTLGWTLSRAVPILNEDGEIEEWIGAASDITDRKQAEEALRESKAELAAELSATKQLQAISAELIQEDDIDALYERILDAAIRLMNSEFASIQVYDPERDEFELLAWRGFHPEAAAYWERVPADGSCACSQAMFQGGRVVVSDMEARDSVAGKDLEMYRLSNVRSMQSTPLVSRSGDVVGMISTHWQEPHEPSEQELRVFDVLARQAADLIERTSREEELRELNETLEERVRERTETIRELASRLTMAEQEERRRISQILHDDLQQLLYGIQLKMSFVRRAAKQHEQQGLLNHIEEASARLQDAIQTTRQLTVDLSPPVLEGEGLTATLQWLQSHMKDLHALQVDLEAEQVFRISDEDMRVLLFQIVRELLFNVVKHAETDRAAVELNEEDDHLVMRVTDEGRGFDVAAAEAEQAQEGGFGLFSVRERLDLFGGRLDIESAPGQGTCVTIYTNVTPETGSVRENRSVDEMKEQ